MREGDVFADLKVGSPFVNWFFIHRLLCMKSVNIDIDDGQNFNNLIKQQVGFLT